MIVNMWNDSTVPNFVKCLASLPNLHTLEIGWWHLRVTAPLEKALEGVELPQVKALILPSYAYPLLRHCRNVEGVVCMAEHGCMPFCGFLESLESNQDSKIKRLTIPVVWLGSPSRK